MAFNYVAETNKHLCWGKKKQHPNVGFIFIFPSVGGNEGCGCLKTPSYFFACSVQRYSHTWHRIKQHPFICFISKLLYNWDKRGGFGRNSDRADGRRRGPPETPARCGAHLKNRQLAEMEVFVFFIQQMTLLVRAVGGGKLTPYESNCWKSLRVCVRA